STRADETGWTPLLSEDLSEHWEAWFGVPHKSLEVPGYPPQPKSDGKKGEPIGLVDVNNDPLDLYTVSTEDAEPMLRISGQIYAGLTTLEEYENYHISLEFKWGTKKWAPRLADKRDSGLLLHCTGEHGAFWNVWMADIECQIQEGDCGDLYLLAGTKARTRARLEAGGKPVYDPTGDPIKRVTRHAPSTEKPNGEWNQIEAYVLGDDMVFVVNGTPVNAPLDCTYRGKPLTRGKIQIQSEGAEVFYRRVKIRPIAAFPDFLADHVRPLD
ncbi:MAG: DUF1080 domain-containing protein, partial [Planctomycetota bacterium]